MRTVFAATASSLLDEDPLAAVVLAEISADLFAKAAARHPERVLNVGIREQLMVSVGGGLALAGLRPIVHTYAPFLVERAFEQVKLDLAHQDAHAVLASIGLAAFGFFCFGNLGIRSAEAPTTALAVAGAMVFVAFGLMIVRRDVASQAVGFFSLENAISLAALVVAAGLPLILETAFLFDLLVAVVVFTLLIRAHHTRSESLSTADLTKLQG